MAWHIAMLTYEVLSRTFFMSFLNSCSCRTDVNFYYRTVSVVHLVEPKIVLAILSTTGLIS
jgi:hypothetical protein